MATIDFTGLEVNCSALPETLAESELFGHERGAFTGARTARTGSFEAAIEDRRIRRVGGTKTIAADVRVIAATNCELKNLVSSGQFRGDLFRR